jgi:hypothetical protein
MGIKNEQASRKDEKKKYKSPRQSLRKNLDLGEINVPGSGLAQHFFHPSITLLM